MLKIKKNRTSKNDKKPYGNWKKVANKYPKTWKKVVRICLTER